MTKPAVRQAAALLKSIWQAVVTARRYIMNYRKTTLMKCLQRNQKEYLKDMQKKSVSAATSIIEAVTTENTPKPIPVASCTINVMTIGSRSIAAITTPALLQHLR